MNHQVYHLGDLEVEPRQLNQVFQIIFSSILFHRSFGVISPEEGRTELFPELIYPIISDERKRNEVKKKIRVLCDEMINSAPDGGEVSMSFNEKKTKETLLGSKIELAKIEEWIITINLIKTPARDTKHYEERRNNLESKIGNKLNLIVNYSSINLEHIPSIVSPAIDPFPWELSLLNKEKSGLMTSLKKFIFTQSSTTGPL